MANIKLQRVVGDSGSQELEQLRLNYNNLVDILGTLITGLKTAVIGDVNTLATAAELAMEANVTKVIPTARIPLAPQAQPSPR
jgi:hypothetical protein